MATISQFQETRNIFIQYTQYVRPLTFEQWKVVPNSLKSAVLFVQFYDEICAAWHKANAYDFIDGADGVSVTMQYLEKNVSKILENPKKFAAPYIYRVAYNCQYCICHDRKCDKERWDNETSNIATSGDDEYDLFDTVSSRFDSIDDEYMYREFASEMWQLIETMPLKHRKVVDYLMSGDPSSLKKVSKRSKTYQSDPLRDVKVSEDEVEDIVKEIKIKLDCFVGRI